MLSAAELLDVWERNLGATPVQHALGLLASAHADIPEDVLGDLSIGRRDAELLKLRESLFGPEMAAVVNCPDCNERLEATFLTTDMQSKLLPEGQPETLALSIAGYAIEFRLPTSQDAAIAAEKKDPISGGDAILRRCLLSVKRAGQPIQPEELPTEVAESVVHRIEEADPLADVQVSIVCPHCGHQWQSAFDIVSFLWSEIDAWAQQTLSDVHVLASSYGWNEPEILAMSPARRQFYLQAVSG